MKKVCPKHGIYEGKRCPECERERQKFYDKTKRDKEAHKFYTSKRWKKVRDLVMMKYGGLCAECKRNGIIKKADVVDHIIDIKKGGHPYALANLEPLCHACHNKKHNKNSDIGRGV